MSRLLGIDLGGTKLALAVSDGEGRVLARRRRPTRPSQDPERDVAGIVEDARALLREAGVEVSALDAVGLSVPGPVDTTRGCVLDPPNLPGWREVPIGRWVREALGRPVHLENDANAAALAEWRFGAARGYANAVYLTMSTGVGGGIILDGRLYRGRGGGAGEIGHVPVEWQGALCKCGQRGCLEAYVGGRAWAERLVVETPDTSRVLALAGARETIRPEHVVEAAREGDAFACAELARWNDYVARAIVGLSFTLAPDIVVLGTIATAAGEALCFEPVRRTVRAHLWPGIADALSIVPAALGEDAPYLAGICAALQPGGPGPG